MNKAKPGHNKINIIIHILYMEQLTHREIKTNITKRHLL